MDEEAQRSDIREQEHDQKLGGEQKEKKRQGKIRTIR